ncbi:MAG: MFS transporter [Gammaproteobacteria bacterium]|nr:MFS transporter [Gammaproteobacteria bacterium]
MASSAPRPTPSSQHEPAHIGLSTLLTYSLPSVGLSFLFVFMIVMYLKFAIEDLGMAASVVGGIFLLSRVWDAVNDPLIGYLSDRTVSRWGRRHSWMLLSAPLILIFSYMAWSPPKELSELGMILWVTVAIFGFYTAFSMFEVPNLALGAELSQRHEDRNRVFGARYGARSIGLLIAFLGGAAILQGASDRLSTASVLIGSIGLFTVILILFSVWRLPPERADYMGRGSRNPISAIRDVWSNPHARLLLFVYFIEYLGVGGVSTMTPFLAEYVLMKPAALPIILGAYAIPVLISIPAWVWLGNRFEKKQAWMAAMILATIGFGGLFFVSEGDVLYASMCLAVAGIGHGCGNVLGQSLKADIIDYDELKTGERKEGSYFAAWNFAHKLGVGLMIGVVGVSLDWAGFVPKVEQTEAVITVMLVLISVLPFLGYVIGIAVFTRFSLTRADHDAIRNDLNQRARQAETSQ